MLEITKPLEIDPIAERKLELHSFINILSVISSEVTLLGMAVSKEEQFYKFENQLRFLTERLMKSSHLENELHEVLSLKGKTIELFEEHLNSFDKETDIFKQTQDNLNSVFEIVEVRVNEILTRIKESSNWVEFEIKILKNNLEDFLRLFQKIVKENTIYFII